MNALHMMQILLAEAEVPTPSPEQVASAHRVSAVIRGIDIFSMIVWIVFTLCYFYQYFYIFVAWLGNRDVPVAEKKNRFALLICGRNEELVIGHCIDSLLAQDYPKDLITVFVCADNCTDSTAKVAREAGAVVYERFNKELIGKGYALEYLINKIGEDYPDTYDAFIIYDADNIVDSQFVTSMNDMLEAGFNVSTCYRNTKNFSDGLFASCSGLWFLRESKYLNNSRMILKLGSAVSGTGFMVRRSYLEKLGGWHFHLLVEDIQFTDECALDGEKIGFCKKAITYDEQPNKFKPWWNQRLRWAKGFLQLLPRYAARLFKKGVKGSFTCLDMFLTIAPAFILSVLGHIAFFVGLILSFFSGQWDFVEVLKAIGQLLLGGYVTLFIVGLITTITEWKEIRTTPLRKIAMVLMFPIHMEMYLPITIVALFSKPQWKHIEHNSIKTKEDFAKK